MVFASAIGSLPKSGFPTACADALHSGGFTGEIDMDWRRIENDKEKYSAYLCSREWAERREAVRERADGKCDLPRLEAALKAIELPDSEAKHDQKQAKEEGR